MKKRVQISKFIAGLMEILAGLIGFIGGFSYFFMEFFYISDGKSANNLSEVHTIRVIALIAIILGLYCLGKGITDLFSSKIANKALDKATASTKQTIVNQKAAYASKKQPKVTAQDLATAKELLESGALTQEEFDATKARYLAGLNG